MTPPPLPPSPLPPHPIRASRPATRHRDQGTYFPGLLPLTYAYLEAIDCDPETKEATPHGPSTDPLVGRVVSHASLSL